MSEHEIIPEQPETVPGRAIAWALGATVLVIACCVVVVWVLAAFQLTGGGESGVHDLARAATVPPAEPFSHATSMEVRRTAARAQLDTWSWVDRATRRVRMPVDRAMDRYLEEVSR